MYSRAKEVGCLVWASRTADLKTCNDLDASTRPFSCLLLVSSLPSRHQEHAKIRARWQCFRKEGSEGVLNSICKEGRTKRKRGRGGLRGVSSSRKDQASSFKEAPTVPSSSFLAPPSSLCSLESQKRNEKEGKMFSPPTTTHLPRKNNDLTEYLLSSRCRPSSSLPSPLPSPPSLPSSLSPPQNTSILLPSSRSLR